jgi:hypothetical protein
VYLKNRKFFQNHAFSTVQKVEPYTYLPPLIRLFLFRFPDEELGSDLYLDGVVTVVDAKHALEQLQESAADR